MEHHSVSDKLIEAMLCTFFTRQQTGLLQGRQGVGRLQAGMDEACIEGIASTDGVDDVFGCHCGGVQEFPLFQGECTLFTPSAHQARYSGAIGERVMYGLQQGMRRTVGGGASIMARE